MLPFRFIFLLIFMGFHAAAFESTAAYDFAKQQQIQAVANDFLEDQSKVLTIPNLRVESLQPQFYSPKLKVVCDANKREHSILIIKQLYSSFQYLKFYKTVNLKLPSFSIAFPFHSFP